MPETARPSIAVERQTYCAVAAAVLLSLVIMLAAGIIAVLREDAHDFNRAGSLLVIVSLALVAYQFLYETSAERRREAIIAWIRLHNEADFNFSLGEETDTAEHQATHLIHSLIWRSRFTIVFASVGIGVLGEVIHGFGDLILEVATHHLLRS